MRLLLVEPDTHLAERLQESLESEGYVVDLAGTLADARRTAAGADYAAIVMDLFETDRAPSAPDGTRAPAASRAPAARTTPDESGSLDVEIWFG